MFHQSYVPSRGQGADINVLFSRTGCREPPKQLSTSERVRLGTLNKGL